MQMQCEQQIERVDDRVPAFIVTPGIRDFYARTAAMVRSGQLARFIDFDLMSMYRLAPDIMIIDVDPATCRKMLRFVGTRTVNVFGQESTGMYLDQIDIGPYRSQQLAAFNMAVAARKPQWTCVKVQLANDRLTSYSATKGIAYERLIVPFMDEKQQASHLVAMMSCTATDIVDNAFEHREID